MAETKTQTAYDPWLDMREIRLPKAQKEEENFRFCGVNGRYYQVPKGVATMVPRPVYDMLMDAQAAEDEADAYIEANSH